VVRILNYADGVLHTKQNHIVMRKLLINIRNEGEKT
jgi:hypothetical protein